MLESEVRESGYDNVAASRQHESSKRLTVGRQASSGKWTGKKHGRVGIQPLVGGMTIHEGLFDSFTV